MCISDEARSERCFYGGGGAGCPDSDRLSAVCNPDGFQPPRLCRFKSGGRRKGDRGFVQKEETDRVRLLYYRDYIWEEESEKTGGLIQTGHQYRIRYRVEEHDLIGRLTGTLTGNYDRNNPLCVQGTSEYVRSGPVKLIWRCQVLTDPFRGGDNTDGNQIPQRAE